jgi:hypothetical protein
MYGKRPSDIPSSRSLGFAYGNTGFQREFTPLKSLSISPEDFLVNPSLTKNFLQPCLISSSVFPKIPRSESILTLKSI